MDDSEQNAANHKLVTVATFRDLSEALIAKGQLDAAGIPCFLADDNIVRMDWFLSNLMGGVKLNVPAGRADEAAAMLSGEGEPVSGEPPLPQCPKCGSAQVAIIDPDKGFRLGALWVVGIPTPRISQIQWRCGGCGAAWVDDELQPDTSLEQH